MWMKKFFFGILLAFIFLSAFVTYQYSQYATLQITQYAQKSLHSATKNKVLVQNCSFPKSKIRSTPSEVEVSPATGGADGRAGL